MTTKTYDKPAFDPNKKFDSVDEKPAFDPSKPMEPVKKKDSGAESSALNSSSVPSAFPLASSGSKEEIDQYERQKSKFEGIMNPHDPQSDDPIGAVLHPIKQQANDLFLSARKAIDKGSSESTNQRSLSSTNQIEKNKLRTSSDINALGKLKRIKQDTEDKIVPDADVATKGLVSFAKTKNIDIPVGQDGVAQLTPELLEALPKDNETVNTIVRKISDYNSVVDDFQKSGGDVANAAILSYQKENPYFAEQLSKLQGEYGNSFENSIPPVLRGKIISRYLNNPNVKLAAEKDPIDKEKYDNLESNLLTMIPEYGANVVGQEMSIQREEEGENNWLGNTPRKKYMDDLAQRMYANDPQKLSLYNDVVAKDISKYVDTPGILEHLAGGAKHTFSGQLNSLEQAMGLKSTGENIYDELEGEYGQVSAQGKGLHSVTSIIGDMAGMIAGMAVTGGAMKGVGLVNDAATANTINTIATFYGDEKKRADALYPNDPNKSTLRATAMTAAFTQLHNLFPTAKLQEALKNFEPEANSIIDKLSEGTISKEAAIDASKNALKNSIDYIGKVGKQTGKATAENIAVTALGDMMDKALNLDKKKYNELHNDREYIDAAIAGAAGSVIPSAFTVYGQRGATKEALLNVASNPEKFKDVLDQQTLTSPLSADVVKEKKELIDYLGQTKTILDDNKIPQKLQKSYLLHTANERILQQKSDAATEPTLKKKYQEQIKASQEAKDKILKGKDVDILPQETNTDNLADHQKFVKEMFDGDENGSFLKAADRDMLGGKKFDKDKVQDYLEFVAMQSNNIIKDDAGEFVPDHTFDSRAAATDGFDKHIIEAANDMFPEFKKMGDEQGEFTSAMKEKEAAAKISVIQPGEIPQHETTTIAPKEFEADPKPKGPAIILPKQNEKTETSTVSEQAETKSGEPSEPIEAGKETEDVGGEAPPISDMPKSGGVFAKYPDTELSHRGLQDVANEFSLPDVKKRDTKTDVRLYQDARETANDWANRGEYAKNVEGLIVKAESGEVLTDKERVILQGHMANVREQLSGISDKGSPEFDAKLAEIKRLKDAGQQTRSEAGAALRISSQGEGPKDVADFLVEEMDVTGVNKLTEKQKEEVVKEYEEISSAEQAWKDKYAALEAEHSRVLAEKEIAKVVPKKKSDKKDFKAERAEIYTSIKDKLKKARGETNVTGIPYAKELFVIAPDVAKLVKNLVEDGVTKLAEVVKQVHAQLKEDLPYIQESDVRDMIAGKYNEKKLTKSEAAITLRNLKTEASLIDRLERLEAGEEPKVEKKKIARNKEISELQNKIRGLKAERAAEQKRKEDDIKAAEKAKEDAIKEEEKFIRDFEKEKDSEAKKQQKEKVEKAKSLASELGKKTNSENVLSQMKGRYEKEIKKIEYQLKAGDFDGEVKPTPVKIDAEGLALKDKLIKLRNERKLRQLKQFYQNQSAYEKNVRKFSNALNLPRALMSSMDYSALLRQALIPVVSNPMMGGRAAKEMFKASFSQKHYDRWFDDLQGSKRYEDMKASKLALTDSTSLDLKAREEEFMSNLADKIPLVGVLTKGSERAYSMLLNKMRVDLYNRFADSMEKRGLTVSNSPQEYKQMAAYVNNSTGRGDVAGILEKAAPFLNALFFSPRLIASRINMLTFLPQLMFRKQVPKEVIRSYFADMGKFIGIGLTVLALAKLNGAQVDDDPRSSDFGKIKSGNTRWDIWGGFQQYAKLGTQMYTGQRVSTTTGKVQELDGEGAFGADEGTILGSFARGKLAPVPSIVWDFITKRNIVGEKIKLGQWSSGVDDKGKKTIGSAEYLMTHFLPLTISGVKEGMQDQGVKGMFTVGVPSLFGVGTQSYEAGTPHKRNSTKLKTKKKTKD